MFGRKKKETELNDLRDGNVVCPECYRNVSFVDQPPLTIISCHSCSKGHVFVPMKLAGFWLFKPLGGGAMGAVYKAFVEGSPELYTAVKILPRDKKNDPTLIANIENEIRIITDLGPHPCIASVIDTGYIDDEYYLAVEYFEGETLDKRIKNAGRLPLIEVISIALRVLQALTHIWNQGYLFRDLKPENIIVNESGAYLFDYGICQRIEEAYEDQGDTVAGSPLYLPPERMVGDVEKAHSEIYSLGMVLYHCIKGDTYYKAKEAATLARQHARTVRLSNNEEKMKGIHRELANVLTKMIAREPEERYQSYCEVELAFTQILLNHLEETS